MSAPEGDGTYLTTKACHVQRSTAYTHTQYLLSIEPGIRLGYTVVSCARSALFLALQKSLLVGFGRDEYGYQSSLGVDAGRSSSTPGALP